jgi:membrane-associated phospholipid phosphatase
MGVAALLLLAGRVAGAQSLPAMLQTDVRNVVGDAWDVWTSPLRARPRDWLTAAGAFALTAAVSPLDDNVDRWAADHRSDKSFSALKELRERGVAFSGRTITPVAAGALVLALATRNEGIQEGLFGCLTAYGASSAVRTFVVYPLVARTRPDSGHSNIQPPPAVSGDQYKISFPGTSDWGRHSFPGGHITNVVACAEFLTRRFSMGPVEPAIWALAGAVAVGRTLDRRHWTSDQVIGAAFGYAVGKEIAIRSSRRAMHSAKQQSSADDSGAFITPTQTGIRLGWNQSF